ncbi:MAG: hypothetical protein DMG78_26545 [Acidobacteria bacterium]|nr:MAG: hypothetical protein DMG78_26545 [Acidobacteriota bacterium]
MNKIASAMLLYFVTQSYLFEGAQTFLSAAICELQRGQSCARFAYHIAADRNVRAPHKPKRNKARRKVCESFEQNI